MLKPVWVPSAEERFHRQVIRRRRQVAGDRVRAQNRIKSEFQFYGIDLRSPRGKWTRVYFSNLKQDKFKTHWMQQSVNQLLEQYGFLCIQIDKQTQLSKPLAQLPLFRDRVKILGSIPGIGILTAMEILL